MNELSSDILESQFGPTVIEIIYQDDLRRLIRTKQLGRNMTLEVSLVHFLPAGIKEFAAVHEAVKDGQSIGKAFRQAGISFYREVTSAYQSPLPAKLKNLFGNRRPATVMTVRVAVGDDRLPYAEITETYHPDVKWDLPVSPLISPPVEKQLGLINRLLGQ
jgi:hypothetical protein